MHESAADPVADPFANRRIPDALCAVGIIAAVLVGVGLRCLSLGTNSLWFDEGYTAWAIAHPAADIIRIISADTAPPLYYLLLHGWTAMFGRSESALRSMSALMASASLLLFVAITWRLLTSAVARLSAIVLFAISFMQIAYAHEARFYAMMTLLAAADLYLVLLLCDGGGIALLFLTSLAWIATLYTNNVMAIYLAMLGVSWLILPGRKSISQRLRDLIIVTIASAICFAPWLPALISQTRRIQDGFWPSPPDGFLLARTLAVLAGVHETSLPYGDWWFTLVDIAILGTACLACIGRQKKMLALALILFGLTPILLVFIYSLIRQPIFMERAFLPTGLVIPLLLALALESASSRMARSLSATLILVLVCLSVKSLPVHWQGEHTEQWSAACAYADAAARPVEESRRAAPSHHATIFVANEGELLYDFYRRKSDYTTRVDLIGSPMNFFTLDPPRTMQRVKSDSDLQSIEAIVRSGKFDTFSLIASHSWWGDHDEKTLSLLETLCDKVDEKQFKQIRVFHFRLRSPAKSRPDHGG